VSSCQLKSQEVGVRNTKADFDLPRNDHRNLARINLESIIAESTHADRSDIYAAYQSKSIERRPPSWPGGIHESKLLQVSTTEVKKWIGGVEH